MIWMRDLLAHAYFHFDPELLWDIAAVRIPLDLVLLRVMLAHECTGTSV